MLFFYFFFFFFFKQKTAYEMVMSDWSSDVCSSDLLELLLGDERVRHLRERAERCLLVAFDGFVPPGRARPIAREKPSTLEERTRERAADGPHVAGALHHVLELAALAAVQAGEAEAREEIRHGDADIGIRRHERLLRLLDVGAALEELGRQTDGRLGGG